MKYKRVEGREILDIPDDILGEVRAIIYTLANTPYRQKIVKLLLIKADNDRFLSEHGLEIQI